MLSAMFLISTIGPAQSCLWAKPRKMADMKTANLVFRGHVTSYVADEQDRSAIITFKVIETLHGKSPDQVVALWREWAFRPPKEWEGSMDVIVAVMENSDATGPRFRILHEPCSRPLMIKDVEENLKPVRKLFGR